MLEMDYNSELLCYLNLSVFEIRHSVEIGRFLIYRVLRFILLILSAFISSILHFKEPCS